MGDSPDDDERGAEVPSAGAPAVEAGAPEQGVLSKRTLDALFGEDGDDSDDEQGRGEGGGDDGEGGPAVATKRSQRAKKTSELKQRLQRLAQGKKAEEKKAKRKIKDAAPDDDTPAKKGVAKKLRKSRAAPTEAAAPEATGHAAAPAVDDGEDDSEGVRTAADEAFIDDEGAAAPDSDDEAPADLGTVAQAEEAREDHGSDDEIDELFKPKSNRRREKTEAEHMALRGEAADLVAEMDVAAEQDVAARAANQLGVAKLRMLDEVERQLCRVELQKLCMDHNLLGALASWLRPGSDGSLPNLRLRSSLLSLCSRLPIDTQQEDVKDQLKRSGLGKVVMFYKLHDEVAANRTMAAHLVETWSRPIFSLSAVYKDLDREEAELPARQQEPEVARRRAAATAHESELAEGDTDARLQPGESGYRHHAAIPEAARLDYVRRPESKVSAAAAAKTGKSDKDLAGGAKIMKALSQKRVVKERFSAHKVSVEGRGMVMKD